MLVRHIAAHLAALAGRPAPFPGPFLDQELPLTRRHVVLLLIDGLGDDDLCARAPAGFLRSHRTARLSSVFPSTTASAVTSLMTGLPPSHHGLTGWFIRERRLGGVLAPLLMQFRGAGGPVKAVAAVRRLFPYQTLFQRLPCPSTVVAPWEILDSPFNRRHSRGAGRVGYRSLDELVPAVLDAVGRNGGAGGYVYAYYPRYDGVCHRYGVASDQARREFWRVDEAVRRLAEGLAGRGVDLLVTADHGFGDVTAEQTLELAAWPEVTKLLTAPLWGERRIAWCATVPGAQAACGNALAKRLGPAGSVFPSADLVQAGYLGRGPTHRRLTERVGDLAIVMAPGWAVRDRVAGEIEHPMIGLHGGVSAMEMGIPLIHCRCD
ncbi:MAG: alkaline phosphatase family protein [Zoogloeaceae bacterium]|nr:alkaline phosphatase family protein [Zoogloeaceae bacterium]